MMPETKDWPTNDKGHYICNKNNPMPKWLSHIGRWEHDDAHETDYDGEYSIEWKCNSCGRIWKTEMPE